MPPPPTFHSERKRKNEKKQKKKNFNTPLPNDIPLLDQTPLADSAVLVVATGFADIAKRVPEPEGFVACAGDNDTAVGTHAEVQYTVCVAGQTDDLRHGWVFPDVDGVLRETVRGHEFRGQSRKQQVTDLRARVVGTQEVRVLEG